MPDISKLSHSSGGILDTTGDDLQDNLIRASDDSISSEVQNLQRATDIARNVENLNVMLAQLDENPNDITLAKADFMKHVNTKLNDTMKAHISSFLTGLDQSRLTQVLSQYDEIFAEVSGKASISQLCLMHFMVDQSIEEFKQKEKTPEEYADKLLALFQDYPEKMQIIQMDSIEELLDSTIYKKAFWETPLIVATFLVSMTIRDKLPQNALDQIPERNHLFLRSAVGLIESYNAGNLNLKEDPQMQMLISKKEAFLEFTKEIIGLSEASNNLTAALDQLRSISQ